MQKIIDVLNTFDSITLTELESDLLMSRFDTKFKFHINMLPLILGQVSKDYYVLDIKGIRLHKYESLYFDTDNYHFFLQHQRIQRNRFKVRFRRYADSNLTFFEIKQKNNKNFTIKNRILHQEVEYAIENETADFLKKYMKIDPETLHPKLWVYYSRITLVNKNAEERLTIDVNPIFCVDDKSVPFQPLVIAEVKQVAHVRSPFLAVMKQHHIIVEDISKYCMGIYMTHEGIKKNNFKRNILSIKKLCNEKN